MKHESTDLAEPVTAGPVRVPITPSHLLALFLRDAATYGGLTDETVCSFGWWRTAPGDDRPRFNARLRVTLGELRNAAVEQRRIAEEVARLRELNESLRDTVRKREADHLGACAEADELRAVVDAVEATLSVETPQAVRDAVAAWREWEP